MKQLREKDYDRLRNKIEEVINIFSLEQGSDTPDYILADYLVDCLMAYDKALQNRDQYYNGKCIENPAVISVEEAQINVNNIEKICGSKYPPIKDWEKSDHESHDIVAMITNPSSFYFMEEFPGKHVLKIQDETIIDAIFLALKAKGNKQNSARGSLQTMVRYGIITTKDIQDALHHWMTEKTNQDGDDGDRG